MSAAIALQRSGVRIPSAPPGSPRPSPSLPTFSLSTRVQRLIAAWTPSGPFFSALLGPVTALRVPQSPPVKFLFRNSVSGESSHTLRDRFDSQGPFAADRPRAAESWHGVGGFSRSPGPAASPLRVPFCAVRGRTSRARCRPHVRVGRDVPTPTTTGPQGTPRRCGPFLCADHHIRVAPCL